jgi:hypothetical protein
MLFRLRPVNALARSRRFRRATSRVRLLPSFLVMGTQAGAVSLFNALTRHADVAGPTAALEDVAWAKELHFFDQRFWRGVNWYRSCFPLLATRLIARRRGGDLIAGEATPAYLFHPAVPARVAATVPDVKLIALLRDPVDRAHAHYEWLRRTGLELLSFEEALLAEDERTAQEEEERTAREEAPRATGSRTPRYGQYAYVARGLYAEQLERWFACLPRDQFLILRAEDFEAQPADVFAEALSFLGLRTWRPRSFGTIDPTTPGHLDPAVRAQLVERFAEPNARLARLLDRDLGWTSPPSREARATDASPASS